MSPIIASFLFIFYYGLATNTGWGKTEWHLNDSHTLNVSATNGSLYEGITSYEVADFRVNASLDAQIDAYSFLCFISQADGNAFYLSICSAAADVDGGLDTHVAIVWCANRQNPVMGKLVTLTLQEDGDLVLKGDGDTKPAWSTGTTNKGVVKMQLVQSPINLILYGVDNEVVWQISMDSPTNSLTYSQTLRTGKELVSWSSPIDPSEGRYSLVVGAGSVALYVSSVPSSGRTKSQSLPYWNFSTTDFHNYSNVATVANYLGFALIEYVAEDKFIGTGVMDTCPQFLNLSVNTTFLRLESDGSLRLYILEDLEWSTLCSVPSSSSDCSFPLQCGPYGICSPGGNCACPAGAPYFSPLNASYIAEGCSLTQPLPGCNSSSLAGLDMLDVPGADYFANAFSLPASGISSEDLCKSQCLGNCSCLAAFWYAHTSECFHVNDWIGSLQGSQNASTYRAFLKVRRSLHRGRSHLLKPPAIIVSTPAAFLIITACIFIYCCKLRRWSKNPNENEEVMLEPVLGLPTRYTYIELQAITRNFSKLLGRGGFGAVYEGMLDDGTKVAVKKLESMRQGDKEFRSEVAVMAGTHHHNLLHLLGFCAQGAHRLLVYEYMEKGSLDQWLFESSTGARHETQHKPLAWDLRVRIAVGIAKGLAYLHDSCQEKIIHLDVKPQNVLLDNTFLPKVADFGLSRLVGREESHVMTTMRGTPGYLAPELLNWHAIDEKCDVFSFGMLLLEIISGRKNFDSTQESSDRVYYPEWAFKQAQGAEYRSTNGSDGIEAKVFTDAKLQKEDEEIQVKRMIKTAFLCVLEDPTLRPSMEQVVQMLEGLLDVMPIQLSSLLQGLVFVLSRNAKAHDHLEMVVKAVLAPSTTIPTISSIEILAR